MDPVTGIVIPLWRPLLGDESSTVRVGGEVDATIVFPALSFIVNVPSAWIRSSPNEVLIPLPSGVVTGVYADIVRLASSEGESSAADGAVEEMGSMNSTLRRNELLEPTAAVTRSVGPPAGLRTSTAWVGAAETLVQSSWNTRAAGANIRSGAAARYSG